MNFNQFGVSLGYKRVQKLGDKLESISNLIDWEKFRKFFERDVERKSNAGRPLMIPYL